MPMRLPVAPPPMQFPFFRRPIQASFDADQISSDGGVLLLRALDERLGLSAGVAGCIPDQRRAQQVIHPRAEQIRQRIYQIALGYPDCNDADRLRTDPLIKLACDRAPDDPQGLSSQATLTRLENVATPASIRKLVRHMENAYVAALPADTTVLVLDMDTTEDPAHGQQEFIGFNAYYDSHMYLHLLVFDDQGQLVTALLRPGRAKASQGVAGLLVRLVRKLKYRFPDLQIVFRGDGAFATPPVLATLEDLKKQYGDVDYLLGFAKNPRLEQQLAPLMEQAHQLKQAGSVSPVLFTQFTYQTTKSWPHPRLIIGKAEYTAVGPNPRFLVTSIEGFDPGMLYRQGYCPRGQAENGIKDFKNALRSDRLSCHDYWANFLRLLLFAAAYRLMFALRQHVVELERQGTAADAKPLIDAPAQSLQLDTLRLKLLKVGAQVKQTARRLLVRLSSSFLYQALFTRLATRLESQAVPAG